MEWFMGFGVVSAVLATRLMLQHTLIQDNLAFLVSKTRGARRKFAEQAYLMAETIVVAGILYSGDGEWLSNTLAGPVAIARMLWLIQWRALYARDVKRSVYWAAFLGSFVQLALPVDEWKGRLTAWKMCNTLFIIF